MTAKQITQRVEELRSRKKELEVELASINFAIGDLQESIYRSTYNLGIIILCREKNNEYNT